MPAGLVTSAKRSKGGRRSEDLDGYFVRTRTPLRVTRWCPAQQDSAAHGEGSIWFVSEREKGAVGQRIDGEPMAAFAAAIEPLPMQHAIDVVGAARGALLAGKSRSKRERIGAAALETGTMPGGERGRLVQEEQLGVARAPDLAVPALEFEHATDPAARYPPARAQRAVIAMKPPAAIAEYKAARGIGEQIAERIDAIGKRHRFS